MSGSVCRLLAIGARYCRSFLVVVLVLLADFVFVDEVVEFFVASFEFALFFGQLCFEFFGVEYLGGQEER